MNYITLRELEAVTGYSRKTIARHRADNVLKLAAIRRVPGMGLRVDVDAAERYIAAARPRRRKDAA